MRRKNSKMEHIRSLPISKLLVNDLVKLDSHIQDRNLGLVRKVTDDNLVTIYWLEIQTEYTYAYTEYTGDYLKFFLISRSKLNLLLC